MRRHVPIERTGKNPEKELNKMEVSYILDIKFKAQAIRKTNKLRRKIGELTHRDSKYKEGHKYYEKKEPVRSKKNTINEIGNTLHGINSR